MNKAWTSYGKVLQPGTSKESSTTSGYVTKTEKVLSIILQYCWRHGRMGEQHCLLYAAQAILVLWPFYSAKLFLHGRIDTQHDKAWPHGQMALGYLVGVVEEKLRSVFAETHTPIRKLIADRVQYAATVRTHSKQSKRACQ